MDNDHWNLRTSYCNRVANPVNRVSLQAVCLDSGCGWQSERWSTEQSEGSARNDAEEHSTSTGHGVGIDQIKTAMRWIVEPAQPAAR